MNKKRRPVHGVGINDAGYFVEKKVMSGGKSKRVWACPFYRKWAHMLQRCYSKKYQEKSTSYAGCYVVPEWHTFSAFRAWMITQPWEGNELDKDILKPGNKVYSPDTCIFVSSKLNTFMVYRKAGRGDLPLGVTWHKGDRKNQAQCCNPFTGKYEFLGHFTDPAEAHESWRKRKHELACMHAEMQTDPRIAEALRTRYLA